MKSKRELQGSDLVFSFNPRKLLTVAVAGLLTYRRLAPSHDFFTVAFAKRLLYGLQQRDCSGFPPDSFAQIDLCYKRGAKLQQIFELTKLIYEHFY